jgi:chromate transporter
VELTLGGVVEHVQLDRAAPEPHLLTSSDIGSRDQYPARLGEDAPVTDHEPDPRPHHGPTTAPLREVTLLFLKLGTIAFGGPAAHIALMHDEVVRRRRWLDEQHFIDLVGATNLIPGPNSTELAIHLGYRRARWPGLVAAGVCFILPAFVIVLALAWAYVRYGRTPAVGGLLYGIKPVVVAIIGWALLSLVRTAIRGALTGLVAAAALAAYLLGVNELLILAAGAVAVLLGRAPATWFGRGRLLAVLPILAADQIRFADPTAGQLTRLFLVFLKIGSVLYGSGYVLLAFLRGDLVVRLGWLTQSQLLDAVSIGQVTPGPVFTTATFVGYLVAGLPGAVLATIGIFLPSFVFVALLTRIVDRIRDRAWSAALLDGVNAAALALMAGVTIQLGRAALIDPLTAALLLGALLLLWRTQLNSAWLIAAGAAVGVARSLLG